MKKNLVLFFAFLFFAANSYFAQPFSHIQKIVEDRALEKNLTTASWGVYAEYVETGKKIISYNENKSLAPASGLKLITTGAAVYILGEDFNFSTKLYYDGEINAEGVLKGNIYIQGGGDPTLGSDLTGGSKNLNDLIDSWIEAVKLKGINKIEGSVVSDDLYFDRIGIPDNWFWVDMGNYYGAGTSGLSINDNLYHLYFKPGATVGDKAEVLRTEPEIPGLTFINNMKTGEIGSGDNGYIYCAPNQFNAELRGTIPAGVEEFSIKGSIPDPALFTALHFSKKLIESGINVSGEPRKTDEPALYDENKLIMEVLSPPLKDIIEIINKRSFNLYAEHILKAIGKKQKGVGSFSKGVEAVKDLLIEAKINVDGFNLNDGSGLSRSNMITAKLMCDFLAFMSGQKCFTPFYNSISIAGDPNDIGFFKKVGLGTELEMNARIKSGTVQRVRSYSGYLKDKSGNLIAFSLIANNYFGTSGQIDAIHREIMIELAKLK